MLQWYLPFSSLKYNCMQSSSSCCSLNVNILGRITFLMNIGKNVNMFCMQKKKLWLLVHVMRARFCYSGKQ